MQRNFIEQSHSALLISALYNTQFGAQVETRLMYFLVRV
jgi:hypothetical protein